MRPSGWSSEATVGSLGPQPRDSNTERISVTALWAPQANPCTSCTMYPTTKMRLSAPRAPPWDSQGRPSQG